MQFHGPPHKESFLGCRPLSQPGQNSHWAVKTRQPFSPEPAGLRRPLAHDRGDGLTGARLSWPRQRSSGRGAQSQPSPGGPAHAERQSMRSLCCLGHKPVPLTGCLADWWAWLHPRCKLHIHRLQHKGTQRSDSELSINGHPGSRASARAWMNSVFLNALALWGSDNQTYWIFLSSFNHSYYWSSSLSLSVPLMF